MSRRRAAFTLLELLVVIAVVAVLIALVLAAVQRARAAAERQRCAGQLRQVALAAHLYADAAGSLPPGVTPDAARDYPRLAWQARLLPYLDQGGLWDGVRAAYAVDRSPFNPVVHAGMATPVAAFTCPADDRVGVARITHGPRLVGLTSFVGNYGTSVDRPDGVLFLGSAVRWTDIADGTAHTLLAGERPPSRDFWYGWWYAGLGQRGTGSADMLLGASEICVRERFTQSCAIGPHAFGPGRFDRQCDLFHYWSPHGGGANFALCDGGVRFVTYRGGVLPALATRAGGEAVDGE